jgi:glycosyltransferase involved in cell wall biosynthesis
MLFRRRQQRIYAENVRWPDIFSYREHCESNSEISSLTPEPSPNDHLILFSVVRNEADILPTFLDHYRKLGVDRFVIIDNDSTDQTREILRDHQDVSLYFSEQKFATALRGRQWIDFLAHRHALNRWIIVVDADEMLTYSNCDVRPLPDLIAILDSLGLKRLFAPLIDLYEIDDELYFDAAPEVAYQNRRGTCVEGGPRSRMALKCGASSPFLTKYPLTLYDENTCYPSLHLPFPRHRNNPFCFARLLHFKLTTRFKRKISEALQHRQYWQGSAEYDVYSKWADTDLREKFSKQYTGSESLIESRLMDRVPWNGSELRPYRWRKLYRS